MTWLYFRVCTFLDLLCAYPAGVHPWGTHGDTWSSLMSGWEQSNPLTEQKSQLQVLKLNSLSILPKPLNLLLECFKYMVHGMNIYQHITPFRTRQWSTASLMNHPAFLKDWDLLEIKSNRVTQVPTCTTDQSLFGREHLEHIRIWHALLYV